MSNAIIKAAQKCSDEYPEHYRAVSDPLATELDHAYGVDELLKHLRALLTVCNGRAKTTRRKRK